MAYPTDLPTHDDFIASETLAAAEHAAKHNAVFDELEALEAKVGVNSSAVTTSHDYKLSGVTGTDKAVSKTGIETLTNKTLTAPSIADFTNANHDHSVASKGGTIPEASVVFSATGHEHSGAAQGNLIPSGGIENNAILYNHINIPYKARAYRNTDQTGFPDAVTTKVQLNAESYDPNNNFDSTTNYRYTVPVTGYYQVNGCVNFTGTTPITSFATIYKNGAEISRGTQGIIVSFSAVVVSDILYFTANDYLELYAYVDVTSGTGTINGGAIFTYLSVHFLST